MKLGLEMSQKALTQLSCFRAHGLTSPGSPHPAARRALGSERSLARTPGMYSLPGPLRSPLLGAEFSTLSGTEAKLWTQFVQLEALGFHIVLHQLCQAPGSVLLAAWGQATMPLPSHQPGRGCEAGRPPLPFPSCHWPGPHAGLDLHKDPCHLLQNISSR